MFKATISIILKSLIFAVIIIGISIFSSMTVDNNTIKILKNQKLDIFVSTTALTIISFLYPIITTSYITLKIYILQQQSELFIKGGKMEKGSIEHIECKNTYDSLQYLSNALLNIIKVLFWVFIGYISINFINATNIYVFYTLALIQITMFIMFFYGLYQIIISSTNVIRAI